MDWISSAQFVETLKRFHDSPIKARRYLDDPSSSSQTWLYRSKGRVIASITDAETSMEVDDFLSRFAADYWKPEPFFFLQDVRQRSLAVRVVEHLIETGNLDWIISDCDINFVRQCDHCHGLMCEGLMCGDSGHYCCVECLLAENPGLTREELEAEGIDVYWSEWEG